MKNIVLATAVALAASASPAYAQDKPDLAGFTGPRAEIFGGWDRAGTRVRSDDGTTRVTEKGHADGATAGGLVGYDMPIGNTMVAGVFGSYAISTTKACDLALCLKAGREIEGGARVGGKLGRSTLLYVKGAYVNGQVRTTDTSGATLVSGRTNRDGWRAGAGAEYALNPHTYLKVEYDYTRFNRFDTSIAGEADSSVRFDRNQVLAGFGIRF
jgi:outer membrane immunogenic protein